MPVILYVASNRASVLGREHVERGEPLVHTRLAVWQPQRGGRERAASSVLHGDALLAARPPTRLCATRSLQVCSRVTSNLDSILRVKYFPFAQTRLERAGDTASYS